MAEGKITTSIKNIVMIAGGMFAFTMGAGFASGQELLQFFVVYGKQFWVPMITAAFFMLWLSISFAKAGYENKFETTHDVYYYYGGKYLGRFFDFFILVYCYACFFFMAASAATVLNETFGLPKIVGAVVLGAVILGTVIFGFEGLAKVMGISGVVDLTLLLIVIAVTFALNWQNIPEGIKLADSGAGITRGGFTGIPLLEGAAYLGGNNLYFAIYLSELGARRPRRDSKTGVVAGSLLIMGVIMLAVMALFSVLPAVAGDNIPNLTLAKRITPFAGIIFTFVILLEVYNTSAPQIWTLAKRIAPDEKSLKFRLWAIAFIAVGIAVALLVPFKTLVGSVLSLCGYVVCLFYILVIVKDIKTWLTHRKEKKNETDEIESNVVKS